MSDRIRLKPKTRKQQILDVSTDLAKEYGYLGITRNQVAEACGITGPLITFYFDNMVNLRQQILKQAVSDRVPEIIAQYIMTPDIYHINVTSDLQQLAADHVRSNNAQNTEGV